MPRPSHPPWLDHPTPCVAFYGEELLASRPTHKLEDHCIQVFLFDHPNNIWWSIQVMNSLSSLLQPPATSSLLVPNILLHTLFSNKGRSRNFFLSGWNKCFIPSSIRLSASAFHPGLYCSTRKWNHWVFHGS